MSDLNAQAQREAEARVRQQQALSADALRRMSWQAQEAAIAAQSRIGKL